MRGVFISYRRKDSPSAASRLADHLKERLPGVPIFLDVASIEPGADFVDAIHQALDASGVFLVVIGPRWLMVINQAGLRRLDDPRDFTHQELLAALKRPDLRLIPVLVDGATMPTEGELPEDLRPLARHNAIELRNRRWNHDADRLVAALAHALGPDAGEARVVSPGQSFAEPRVPVPRKPLLTPWRWAAVAAGGLVILGGLVGKLNEPAPEVPPTAALPGAPLPMPETASINPAAAPPPVTGQWRDERGGHLLIVLGGGGRIRFEGDIPSGHAHGTGQLEHNRMSLSYRQADVDYTMTLEISRDGQQLRGTWHSPATGAGGPLRLRRDS